MNSKVHRDFPRFTYLGYTLDYSPTSPSPCMTLSMPNYIPSMLSHLCPSGCGSASSPAVYTPPVPYHHPSIPTTFSTLVSPVEKTWLQQVIGSLLFYARALDLSILTAFCRTFFPSVQPHPTRPLLCSPPSQLCLLPPRPPQNHTTLFHGSLGLHRANFLSRPKSGSVAGCSVGLEDPHPTFSIPPPESRRQNAKTK
jgi:hypothetical protein